MLSIRIKAGLPNIWGTWQFDNNQPEWLTGAFYLPDTVIKGNGPAGGGRDRQANFDAYKCSEIYGSSDTVTPLSLKTKVFIKY